ncbi:MAG: signal peptidase II [Phycisphaeraceae bacterium]
MALTLAVLVVDLATKWLSFKHVAGTPVLLTRENAADADTIPAHDEIVFVPKLLALKLTTNTGAVFGLGKGSRGVFVLVSVVAAAVIVRVFYRSRVGAYALHLALGLIFAGAVGNLYDRLCFGAVRDMFWLFPEVTLPFGWAWPGGNDEVYPWLFNVADAALVVGVILLMIVMWRHDKRQQTALASRD